VFDKGDGAGWAVLADLRPLLAECEWTGEALEKLIADFCTQRELGMGKVAQPIRVAVTGRTISPGVTDTLMLLGKARTLARIDRCLERKGSG
jgi:glutamyl-tRNA synthetase